MDISIIIPVHNGEKWINDCMKSIAAQNVIDTELKLEIVVCNDGSNDGTEKLLEKWASYFKNRSVQFVVIGSRISKGVGAAKNCAVRSSSGEYLCFQDVDDVMRYDRVLRQWNVSKCNHNAIIGSQISRTPPNSTPRFVSWANNLNPAQLKLQIYTSNGPTLLMPTWFCHRSVFDKVGGFNEAGCGTPEDLIFFYSHLDYSGDLHRVDEKLVMYTYHKDGATFSVGRDTIWRLQLLRLEKHVLSHWKSFTVWNAGKGGRRFVRGLSEENMKKVVGFCDIDVNKIGRNIELYCPIRRAVAIKLPVIHFTVAKPPLIICVKLDLTDGHFENNLNSLNLIEGKDYVLFN